MNGNQQVTSILIACLSILLIVFMFLAIGINHSRDIGRDEFLAKNCKVLNQTTTHDGNSSTTTVKYSCGSK